MCRWFVLSAGVLLLSSGEARALPPLPPPAPKVRQSPPPPPAPKVRRPPPAPVPKRSLTVTKAAADAASIRAERAAGRVDAMRLRRGGGLLAGAVASLGLSVGMQALAVRHVEERCLGARGEASGVHRCVAGEGRIVAEGAAGAAFALAGVGLAAGAGWELGRGRWSRRTLRVLGVLGVVLGGAAMIGPPVARVAGPACDDEGCEAARRSEDLVVRSVGIMFVAGGAASLTAQARVGRMSVAPTRYAGGMGVLWTMRW